ncbi:MAG: hypothetical protein ACPL3C_04600 [Pyrobaculum sp.]
MEKAVGALALEKCFELKEMSLAELEKYKEATPLRQASDYVDEVYKLPQPPIVVDEEQKVVIDGARRLAMLLREAKGPKSAYKVAVLSVRCRDATYQPALLRFAWAVLSRPVKHIERCRQELVEAIAKKSHFSIYENCPVCRSALVLDTMPVCEGGRRADCVPPELKPLVKRYASECLSLVEILVKYGEPSLAYGEVSKFKRETQHAELEKIGQPPQQQKQIRITDYIPPPSPTMSSVASTAAQPERVSEEKVAERRRVSEKEDVAHEDITHLIYIKGLLEEHKEEVDAAVKRKSRLYDMVKNSGFPDAVARLMTWLFERHEIENVVSVISNSPEKGEVMKRVVEALDKYIKGVKVTVPSSAWSQLEEMSLHFQMPATVVLYELVARAYRRYAEGEVQTLEDLFK